MKYIIPVFFGFLFIIIVGSLIVKFFVPTKENPAYDALVEVQKNTFKTSISDNQKTWNNAKAYIEDQFFIFGHLDEYKQSDSSLYRNTDRGNHGVYVDINRKLDRDSVLFKIEVHRMGKPAPFLEKKISLYMQHAYTKYNYPPQKK